MDDGSFDALTRRASLLSLGAAGLAAALASPFTADAKKKGGKNKKNKNNKKRPSQSPSPPPPSQGPGTTADAACPAATTTGHSGNRRYAQTFFAQRSGLLTSASFGLFRNSEGANYDIEIRNVDPGGTPSTVLAGTTIANVPATTSADPPRTIAGDFGSPATVVAGQRYALVVTNKEVLGYLILVNENSPCADSNLFLDIQANGTFDPQPLFDLVFATFVTA